MNHFSLTRPAKGTSMVIVLATLMFLIATGGRGWGQESASIIGTVTDSSGAVVPGASVSVTNLETGITRALKTDGAGNYRALSLPVGQYKVNVQKPGFRAVLKTGINLVVGQEAVVDVALQPGTVDEVITVSGEAPLVNVTTESTAGLVAEQQVKDLPLNGRSFDNLITLNPGTANTTSYRSTTSTGAGQGNNFSVGGAREDYNIFLLNGVEYTGLSTADVIPGGVSGQLLGVDAVREFNVQSNSYGAEYGKRAGGQVRVVTMSGSNQFHGTLFEFLRNNVFDARNFFDQGDTPPFKRNQFGGSAGGPIKKDKLFIFGNYEGFRQSLALSSVAVVPDDAARNGTLVDTTTKKAIGLAPGIAPYFALWPEPNGPDLGGGAALLFSHPVQHIREDFGNIRLDHNLTSSDTLSGAYTIDDGDNLTPGSNPLQQVSTQLRSHVFSLNHVHTFSGATLNSALLGFSRAKLHLNSAMATNDPNLVFVPGQAVGQISIGASGLGTLGSFASAGASGGQQFEIMARNLFTGADEIEMSRGNQLIRIGAWFQRVQSNDNAADQRNGVASFADIKSFMQGKAQQVIATLNPIEIPWRQSEFAAFITDTVKWHPKFTLTAGLRYEYNNGWNSPTGQASNFVFGTNGILLTQPVIGEKLYTQNHAALLWGPRLGIAWSPFKSTAVHAGFGTYYNQLDYMGSCCDAAPLPPFNNKVSVGSKSSPATFPLLVTPNLPGAKPSPSGVDPTIKTPTIEQYSLKIEQGITANMIFSVGYIGSHGYHLLNTVDVNTAIPSGTFNGSPTFKFTGTPANPVAPPRANPALSNTRYTLSNAISNYNALQVEVVRRLSHGLQFRGNYTFSESLDVHSSSFLANEGIGGTTTVLDPRNPRLDYGPSNFDVTHRFTANFSYLLPVGRGQPFFSGVSGWVDKLVSGWQWNGIATIQGGFPFTPLVGFNSSGDGDSRNPDRALLNPGFTGDPIVGTPGLWFDPSAFLVPCTPLVTKNLPAGCPAMLGTFSSTGRNILRGPGLGDFDTSLFKNTKITERVNLQFRAEAFNVLNRANFGMPVVSTFTSTGAVSPSAGLITYTATSSRQLQFGLKLGW